MFAERDARSLLRASFFSCRFLFILEYRVFLQFGSYGVWERCSGL